MSTQNLYAFQFTPKKENINVIDMILALPTCNNEYKNAGYSPMRRHCTKCSSKTQAITPPLYIHFLLLFSPNVIYASVCVGHHGSNIIET